ncbi:hypothetical protein QBC34DRAFT_471452 [Podospora aff. communis PSN243]|uniref:Uncharacterized protein n=1 Tax=Podospora aff. communis PSN243 TaxID=3040156 RepID=A0AAV9H1J7_9PEZI|nr:hypothetical protein QBC34DRAFT_471452 [Podospora aff. communis PSN243]
MPRTTKSESTTQANGFPLPSLPLELREKVWEESLLSCTTTTATTTAEPPTTPDTNPPTNPNPPALSTIGFTSPMPYYTHLPPPLAFTSPESLSVATRLQRTNPTIFRREIQTQVLSTLNDTNTSSLVPFLSTTSPFIISLGNILEYKPNLFALQGKKIQASRFIELLETAKDRQVVLLSGEYQRFIMPASVKIPEEHEVVKGWNDKTRLVCLSDESVIAELRAIAELCDLPWAFADEEGGMRAEIAQKAVAPLEDLWRREGASRERGGKEGLRPLPRVDVCVSVEVTQQNPAWGGLSSMLGVGALDPHRRSNEEELVRWGIL